MNNYFGNDCCNRWFTEIQTKSILRLIVSATLGLFASSWSHQETNDDKSILEVADKVFDHEKKFGLQEEKIATLTAQHQAAKAIIETLNSTQCNVLKDESQIPVLSYAANTYTRWGRSACPGNATLVYEGYAAFYDHKGAAANYLCLPKDPNWDNHTDTAPALAFIYGREYETHRTIFKTLLDHEVPCAVCRVSRTNILMVPGKNVCYQNYDLEYKGYLMAGRNNHPAATEYVCVDGEAEQARNSSTVNDNGVLFYFVQAKCGSLKCPPYKESDYITCAVCSFSP